jgi:hypothetical protein
MIDLLVDRKASIAQAGIVLRLMEHVARLLV